MILNKLGISTSIRDAGREGLYTMGINIGSVLDLKSFSELNLILENKENTAAFEFFYPSLEIVFEENGVLAVTGADFGPVLNGNPLLIGRSYSFKIGDRLKFTSKNHGNVAYLGFKGGLDLPFFENSQSSSKALNFNSLETGMAIGLNKANALNNFDFGIAQNRIKGRNEIRIVPNSTFEQLQSDEKVNFLSNEMEIRPDSNRMGIRIKLENPLNLQEKDKVSTFVGPGTIQILPSGEAVVLMADAQITGGYPTIGFVCAVDLDRFSQLNVYEKFNFQAISIEKARELLIEREKELNLLAFNITLRKNGN
jgi:antagonist of KipI